MTTPYAAVAKAKAQTLGVSNLPLAVVEHPIAGYDLAGVRKKAETDFPIILQAATH